MRYRYRERHRVDWDEELRKTERIRRRGFFISALGFGVAVIFIFGIGRVGEAGADVMRKVIFALCFVLSMFFLKNILSRRKRLKQEREEKEQEQMRMRLEESRREE